MQTSATKSLLSNCRVQLFFCKENANERNESLLSNCRVQLFFCKENANERNESLLSNCRVQLFFCKYMKYFSFMQVFGLFLLCFQRKNVNLQKK